ncbi:hypothetical protein MKS88_003455 [Plasmodium brasilianum]|uniref:Uncharacterized protein n=1 Tax=Plasmodium brasilianum TaxID=5824 RepID=A0ACB9Y8Q0_PLABR|nr:hypothetical protein MKS88_003455 [Plasmodium brasilianum]
MDPKIKLLLFIKISSFILITWICHFKNVIIVKKSLNENFNLYRKLDTINYRLLAKYKKYRGSNTVGLKEDKSYYKEWKKRNISNNEKVTKGKNKRSNRNLLNKMQYYKYVVDYNNSMFDGKHFHFEKKWIKKRNYDDFNEKNGKLCDVALKKIKFRNYGFGFSLFLIFLLLGVGIPLSPALPFLNIKWSDINGDPLGDFFFDVTVKLAKFLKMHPYIVLYSSLMIILSVVLIVVIYKILINNEKYKKIKLMT